MLQSLIVKSDRWISPARLFPGVDGNMTDGAQETVETASAFVEESGFSFPVYYDTEFSAAAAYSVYSLPTTYFIDAEGYGVAYASGAIDLETIELGLEMISSRE